MEDFFTGFEKKAESPGVLGGAVLGAKLGLLAGSVGIAAQAYTTMRFLRNHPDSEEAKKLIKKYKKYAPEGLEFFTKSDMDKAKESLPLPGDQEANSLYSDFVGTGNAGYQRSERIGGRKPQEAIVVSDKLHPSVLAHEIGHALSHQEIDKGKLEEDVVSKLTSIIGQEEDAWAKAPGPIDEKVKAKALRTYKSGWIPPAAAVVGAGIGALVSAKMRR